VPIGSHSLHLLLPPVKSNPYRLRFRDHNFHCQSAAATFEATLLLYAVFIDLNRLRVICLRFCCTFLCFSARIFHMHVFRCLVYLRSVDDVVHHHHHHHHQSMMSIIILLLVSLLVSHCFSPIACCMYVCYVLFS